MKHITRSFVFAMSLTTLAAAPALADSPRHRDGASAQEKAQKVLQAFDANRDGVLDVNEVARLVEFREQRHMKKLTRFDTDGDGRLGPEEREAARATRMQKRAEKMQRFDRNGDGSIDPQERQAMRDERVQHHFDRMLERHDANRDGMLSWSEVSEAAAQHPRLDQRFRAADTNRDGVVTRNEFARAAEMHGDEHRGHGRHRNRSR
jgi:Ca2+-binding EF-hand superfamily protein